MANHLDKMEYSDFTEYLNKNKIKYEELKSWDFFYGDYIFISPISKKLKSRTFYADEGGQAFESDTFYL